jgi:hypothetical protein
MLVGRAVDKSVTANHGSKKDGKGLMPLQQIADLARDALNTEWDGSDVALTKEELQLGLKTVRGEAVDKTVRLSKLHAREKAPEINPTHLQRQIVVELGSYPYDLTGYLDIQEGVRAVRDTKTSAKTPASDIADKDDQLTLYAMMVRVVDGAIPERLYLDYLIDTKTPKAESFETVRTAEDFNPVLRRVENAITVLEKGAFMPARETDWWCNPKWCGYHATCPFVKQPRRAAA